MLGAVHLKTPYIPFLLSWPDKNKAVTYLEQAVNIGYPELNQKIYLAKALHKTGQKEKAIIILNEIINSNPSEDDLLEDLNDINEAKELLKTF